MNRIRHSMTEYADYDARSRTIAKSGAMADVFPFRFSTKYYDAEANLYYYGYRYYSPELGRWMTRDPIEENGGDNLYAFCGNNGMGRVDVQGILSTHRSKELNTLLGRAMQFPVQMKEYLQ